MGAVDHPLGFPMLGHEIVPQLHELGRFHGSGCGPKLSHVLGAGPPVIGKEQRHRERKIQSGHRAGGQVDQHLGHPVPAGWEAFPQLQTAVGQRTRRDPSVVVGGRPAEVHAQDFQSYLAARDLRYRIRLFKWGLWETLSCKKGFPRPFPKNSMLKCATPSGV